MASSYTSPRLEDLTSVGTRISWGAILAGAMVALGLYFLLATLAAAVGMSVSDRVDPTKLETGAVVWTALTTVAALFLGGVVTSLFTAGENRHEALLYGVIMWAVTLLILLYLGAAGVRTGFNAMAASAQAVHMAAPPNAESATGDAAEDHRLRREAATRLTWYVFFGTWISMLAAVGGALVGAGPTFRLARSGPTDRPVIGS